MKVLKFLLYAIGIFFALAVVMGIFAKKTYHIERSIEIEAPDSLVHEQIRFFKSFAKWSPWSRLDPDMEVSYEGTDGTPGAIYRWSGNEDVGKGMQVLKSVTPKRIDMEYVREKPWKSTSPVFFTLEPAGKKTKVTWGYDMHIGFPWNGFAMLTDVDRGVGKDSERGLGNLKKLCENIMNPRYNGLEVMETDWPEAYYIGVRDTLKIGDVMRFYADHTPKILVSLLDAEIEPTGPPAGLFWRWDEKNSITEMAAAYPVPAETKPASTYKAFTIPGGRALVIDFYGPYDSTGNAHRAMDLYMAEKKLYSLSPVIESYVTDPRKEPDTAKWLTKVIYRVSSTPPEEQD
jgi:effector-binding domain-containing protein